MKLEFSGKTTEPTENVPFTYYFSSENSKIWVSVQNTLCINCHFLNFEGLWWGFQ